MFKLIVQFSISMTIAAFLFPKARSNLQRIFHLQLTFNQLQEKSSQMDEEAKNLLFELFAEKMEAEKAAAIAVAEKIVAIVEKEKTVSVAEKEIAVAFAEKKKAIAVAEKDTAVAVVVAEKAAAEIEIKSLKKQIRFLEVEMLRARGAMTSRRILERALAYAHEEININNTEAKFNASETIEKIGMMIENSNIPKSADGLVLYNIFKDCGITNSADARQLYADLNQDIHGYPWYE